MAQPPVLKDWKVLLDEQLELAGHSREDVLKIVHMCQEFTAEIQSPSQWLGQQHSYVMQISRVFTEMYFTRFGEQPPPRPSETPITEVLLDTPERRRQTIRGVALSISKPGDDISDEAILQELKRRGFKIVVPNPTATISTILNGFKPHFERLQGKRGVFRRQQ